MKVFKINRQLLALALSVVVVAGCAQTTSEEHSKDREGNSMSTPTDTQRSEQIVEHKMESRWVVRRGFFKENFERIAHEIGIDLVVWDERTENCEWRQSSEFVVPRNTPHEALAFYADTQDFHLIFSNVDNSVRARYEGPRSRLSYCN